MLYTKETDPIQSNILKGEKRENKYLSLWTMETLVLLLAILIIVLMAVTVRIMLYTSP
jgi:type II secretory pathway component PulL